MYSEVTPYKILDKLLNGENWSFLISTKLEWTEVSPVILEKIIQWDPLNLDLIKNQSIINRTSELIHNRMRKYAIFYRDTSAECKDTISKTPF